MTNNTHVELIGFVIDTQRGKFKIKMENSETIIWAQLSGKMRQNKIMVVLGDRVKVKCSPFDLTHGIIVSRETTYSSDE